MLSVHEIQQLISSGEGYNVEFKVRLPSKVRELTQEICAFANAAGGTLILGVDDTNHIKGLELENKDRATLQQGIHEINPRIDCHQYSVDLPEGRVWVIEVPSGPQKPYILSGAIYVRQGSTTQKITGVEQMRDFFQQSGRIYFDEGPCQEFQVERDLHAEFFEEFRYLAHLSATVPVKQVVQSLKLYLSDGRFKNGGVLFFGRRPEEFFEKAAVRCVAFDGTTRTQIVDDKIFGGPLMLQYQEAMHWLKGKLDVRYEITDGGPREEIWEIPEVVFKESLINALTHRDYYDKGGRITVELFEDRVEITNPGGLVSVIPPEKFGTKSHSRNPLLFGLFERMHMVEQIGSGIGRIRTALAKSGLPAPEFQMHGLFSVTFLRRSSDRTSEKASEKTSEKTSEKMLRLIRDNREITIEELAAQAGITSRSVERTIRKLKDEGRIERIGPDKGGFWKIKI